MISVTEAKQIIIQNCTVPEAVSIKLAHACGRVTAEDIFSTTDIPNFPQSSMDGYAFNFAGYQQHRSLQLIGEIAAGDQKYFTLKPNEAVRIFTGAPVPQGADTVVMQERSVVENNTLSINDDVLKPGNNVRLQATEIKTGELAFEKESLLTPAAMGFLSGIGITNVKVYPSPVVSIITTGNELQEPGIPLNYGQVYESNSIALEAALRLSGVEKINLFRAKDDLLELTNVLQNALIQSDIVLLTGGVSVGDYDFVLQAAENCGIKKLFHKVKQKPGKPLFFGKKGSKLVFGLPGNPSSVLTCFYQYVTLALQEIKNNKYGLRKVKVGLASAISKPAGLTHFLKGYYDGTTVQALTAQESFRMSSFARSNCLVEIDEDTTQLNANDQVNIYLFGYC